MNLTKTFAAFALLSVSASVSAVELQETPENLGDAPFLTFLETKSHDNSVVDTLTKMRGEFVSWMEKFGKKYESLEKELERMMIWVENHKFIESHNSKTPKPSYTVGHNKFSDMTSDEFHQFHSLGKYSPGVDAIREAQKKAKELSAMRKIDGLEKEHPAKAEFRYLRSLAAAKSESDLPFLDDDIFNFFDDGVTDDTTNTTDDTVNTDDDDTNGLPEEVDWVSGGAVTPVKNQGNCGSCWAFSSTGAIEGASFVKYGELVSLSEQNLLDCDTVDNGCNGGLMENAFKFDESAHGLCSEADYPYLASDGHLCSTNCTKVNGTAVADYIDLDESDKHGLIASIAMQPTSIAMEADQLSFQFYSGGVFDAPECGESGQVDHGVLAVGYGTDADTGKKYFNVKNSWGEDWGESGYFRLSRQSKNQWGTCAILMIMTVPIMA